MKVKCDGVTLLLGVAICIIAFIGLLVRVRSCV